MNYYAKFAQKMLKSDGVHPVSYRWGFIIRLTPVNSHLCIQGSQLSRKHFKLLLAHFNYRWNTRCGIRNRGRTDFGSYSHWIIKDIQNICGEHIDKEQFGEFEPAVKELDLARIGVKVEEIGIHATTIDHDYKVEC